MTTHNCLICSTDLSRWRKEPLRPRYKTKLFSNVVFSCGHRFHTECAQKAGENCRLCGKRSTSFDVIALCEIVRPHNCIVLRNVVNTSRKKCSICLERCQRFVIDPNYKYHRFVKQSNDIELQCGHVFHINCFREWAKQNRRSACCRRNCTNYLSVKYTEVSTVYTTYSKFASESNPYYVPGRHNDDAQSGCREL